MKWNDVPVFIQYSSQNAEIAHSSGLQLFSLHFVSFFDQLFSQKWIRNWYSKEDPPKKCLDANVSSDVQEIAYTVFRGVVTITICRYHITMIAFEIDTNNLLVIRFISVECFFERFNFQTKIPLILIANGDFYSRESRLMNRANTKVADKNDKHFYMVISWSNSGRFYCFILS